jgi:phage tail sheath protein FI
MLQEGYPGVHIMEVPSGVRTIVGASTSNLALIGHFPRGPVDEAVRVTSWGDVERMFGGLDRRFVAPYCLQEFYNQGGSTAFVVRIAFQSATAVLTATEAAMTITARSEGAAGDDIRVGFSHNSDGTFNMVVLESDEEGARREHFVDLSPEVGSARFAEARVNAPEELGGSTLVTISNVRHRPAETNPGTAAADLPADDLAPLDNGAIDAASVLQPQSSPLPALTFQSMTPGAGGNTATVRSVITDQATGRFTITFGGTDDVPGDLTDLTIDPADPNYVVTRVAGSGFAGVVTGRHPLRVPSNTTAEVRFAGGGDDVPAATAQLLRTDNTAAMLVTAANPGGWGNSLRVGAAPTPTGGFDLLVAEFRGGERVAAETYRNLNLIPNDASNAATVINQRSAMIRLSEVTALPAASAANTPVDGLALAQMTPLTGGLDGVLPGEPAWVGAAGAAFQGSVADRSGIHALDGIVPEVFNLMAIPEAPLMADLGIGTYAAAGAYCRDNLAFLLVDHPDRHDDATSILDWNIAGFLGTDLARSAAICFPRIIRADPLGGNREMPSSGSIAGVMARTDGSRGVWKAPAGLDASISGVIPSVMMTDRQQGRLNQRGINCLRAFPAAGTVNWGARTLAGADTLASEWKYVPVRRTALFLEQSLKAALPWTVFEPNDEALWAQVRLNVGAFMQSLFVRGAFQGTSPREAYLVKCDAETTTQQDINSGILNILVGFAPLRPAEFVVVRLTQLAGRLAA